MYYKQLLGLALSALTSVTPINYDWDIWQFPQTRTVSAHFSTDFSIQDLGYKTSVVDETGIGGSTVQEQNAVHNYVISYDIRVDCSEACYVASTDSATQISSTSFSISAKQAYEKTPNEMFALRNFTQNGTVTNSLTFASASDTQRLQLQVPMMNNVQFNVWVYFKGFTEGVVLNDIADHTLNASSYLLRLVLRQNFNNQNFPADVMNQYQQYIDNGDYSTAYTYINNYIDQQTTIENTETNNEINNYDSQHTDLINNFNIENSFANQVETDFTTQSQNIPLSDTANRFNRTEFIQSANWVTQQFNRLTVNANMFGSLLKFSLVTGFILSLIGRFKR